MILYTCSYPHEIEQYLKFFKEQGIHFRFVNQNPEVVNEAYGFYEQKFYFNVLFEDKSGFDPEQDWEKIYTMLKNNKTEACILQTLFYLRCQPLLINNRLHSLQNSFSSLVGFLPSASRIKQVLTAQ
ncbi:hypothetical protein D3C78_1591030 [compost metagenome]